MIVNGPPNPMGGEPIRSDDQARALTILGRDVSSVGEARAWLGDFLAGFGVGAEAAADAVLIASELVTNGLRHGLGDVVVRARLDAGNVLQLAVTDAGDELPRQLPLDPMRIGGVGLRIVDQLSEQWGVSAFPGGKTVWALVHLQPRN